MNRRTVLLILFVFSMLRFGQAQDPFETPVNMPDALEEAVISQAVAFADYDNDGWVDVYISRSDNFTGASYENLLYKNNQGTFVLQDIAGITDYVRTTGAVTWGDYDNDGHVDLYVAVAQNGFAGTTWPNNLFQNDGAGSFMDLTDNSSVGALATLAEDSRHVGWGDYNNDGYPDMFVDNGSIGLFGPAKGENTFFENDGDGSFTELTVSDIGNIVFRGSGNSPFKTFGSGFGWSDYNNDGYLDLFNCSGGGDLSSLLWTNTSGTGFDTTGTSIFQVEGTSFMGASWVDYDNDGDTDLFVTNPIDNQIYTNFLFQNNSTTTNVDFTIVSDDPLTTDVYNAQGSTWGDVDNDGDLDVFVSNAEGADAENAPATLYANSGNSGGYTFSRLQDYYYPNNGDPFHGRGVAFADVNNDGFLDLVACHGDNLAGESWAPLLYINGGDNGNGFTNIQLVGTGTTNASAIGSRVKVTADIPEQGDVVTQMREISGQTGAGGQNSLRAHFGLGSATFIDSVRVEWLNSTSGSERTINSFKNLPVNAFMVFTGGADDVDAEIIPNQSFLYLTGTTGAAVEFTALDDADGGALNVVRYRTGPVEEAILPGTVLGPDGSLISPDTLINDRYWDITQTGLSDFTSSVYLDVSDVPPGSPLPEKMVVLQRSGSGVPWEPMNSEIIGNTLYAEGLTGFSEFAVGYEKVTSSITGTDGNRVSDFMLYANYPNPFNPSTQIRFDLPVSELVTIDVYNALGQTVATLVNANMPAGQHQVTFDATDLTSGVYYYRIQAGAFSQVRKMLLVR